MASTNDPNFNLFYGWDLGEDNWNTGMDTNMKKLGALIHLYVASRTTTTPPSVVNGARYIIPSGATGVWSGKTNQVAVGVDGAWTYYTPITGVNARVQDESDKVYYYDGSSWSLDTIDTSGFVTESGANNFTAANSFVGGSITVPTPTTSGHASTKGYVDTSVDAINYTNVGAGAGIFKDITGDDVNFKSFIAGTNVTFGLGTDAITINASPAAGSAQLSANNVFTGTTNTFNGVTATTVTSTTINSTTHNADNIVPKGGAATKAIGADGNEFDDLYVKAISNMDTPDGSDNSDGANVGYVKSKVNAIGATNLGTGIGVYKTRVGDNLQFRKLAEGTDIGLAVVGDTVEISWTGSTSGTMAKATYDPGNISANAFDRSNHTGTQAISTVAGLSQALYPVDTTGTAVAFVEPKFYGSSGTPETGNITHDLTDANKGVEITIYHNDASEPSYPAEWVPLGSGTYATSTLNLIVARYVSASRIEYVITQ